MRNGENEAALITPLKTVKMKALKNESTAICLMKRGGRNKGCVKLEEEVLEDCTVGKRFNW